MTRTFNMTALLLGLITAGCEVRMTKRAPEKPDNHKPGVSEVKVDGYSIVIQAAQNHVLLGGGHAKIQFDDHRLDLELASGKIIVDGAGLGRVARADRIHLTAQGSVFVNGTERRPETERKAKTGNPPTQPDTKTPAAKEAPPVAPARVTLTGTGNSFVQLFDVTVTMRTEESTQKALAGALRQITATVFKRDDKTGLLVVLPAGTISFLDAVQKMFNRPVAVVGWLTTTEDVRLIAASGSPGARRVALLVAETLIFLDETNRAQFPPQNAAVVEGLAVKRLLQAGLQKTEWAIENADGHIALHLPATGKAPANRTRIKATGKLVIADGQVLLRATKVDAVK